MEITGIKWMQNALVAQQKADMWSDHDMKQTSRVA